MIKADKSWSRNGLEFWPENGDELFQALYLAYLMAKRGKVKTDDEHKFEMNKIANLLQLRDDIITGRYHPRRGSAFMVFDPVTREIFAASFRDRVVHHLLFAINGYWWDRRFCYDSYSCRPGKGVDFGVSRVQSFMRKATEGGTKEAIIFKGDIKSYFMSIDREILFEKIVWGLNRQFPERGWLYDLCRYLWAEVIFDDPTENVKMVDTIENWRFLPENKSLFNQPAGKGIVIGNLTSQLASNIYLDEFDWFMKFQLGCEFYGRYVDDFVAVVREEDYGYMIEAFKTVIPEFLSEMGLSLHPNKRYVQSVSKGCRFLGRNIGCRYITPGKRICGNFYQALGWFESNLIDESAIISYLGVGKNINAGRKYSKIFEKRGLDYVL